ncbi:hypothetical protein ACXVUM_09625 [Williamsia sp. SKLECPSW1]
MTIAVILIPVLLVAAVAVYRNQIHTASRPRVPFGFDSTSGGVSDLSPDADRVRAEIRAMAAHEQPVTDTRHGFPGPGWIGMR